jgi:hypothetical protein
MVISAMTGCLTRVAVKLIRRSTTCQSPDLGRERNLTTPPVLYDAGQLPPAALRLYRSAGVNALSNRLQRQITDFLDRHRWPPEPGFLQRIQEIPLAAPVDGTSRVSEVVALIDKAIEARQRLALSEGPLGRALRESDLATIQRESTATRRCTGRLGWPSQGNSEHIPPGRG